MCLGIPAQLVAIGAEHPDLATVDMVGVRRTVNVGLLDQPSGLAEGEWVLVHQGFALSTLTPSEAREALQALDGEPIEDRVPDAG